jgi:ABC-2 type transport system permease protein
MFYVFFGVVFAQGPNMPAYLFATYCVFGVIGPALFSFGVGVSVEKQQGWLGLKQTSPMPISAYFVAKVIAAMTMALIVMLELMLAAILLGGVELSISQWLGSFALCLLGTLPFCALGLWLGLLLKANSAAAVVNLIYLPMAFLSGLWMPIAVLPEVVQKLAFALPAFHLSQLVLKLQESDIGYAWWMHVLSLSAMSIAFFTLAYRAFKRQSESA